MDARAMEDHDWDECGCEIARLYEDDYDKFASIEAAWWDTDSDDQYEIHEYLCENSRDPAALEKVHTFEKLALEYEKRRREEKAKLAAEKEKLKAARESLAKNEEYQKLRHLLIDQVKIGTMSGTTTAMDAADIRYKTENAW